MFEHNLGGRDIVLKGTLNLWCAEDIVVGEKDMVCAREEETEILCCAVPENKGVWCWEENRGKIAEQGLEQNKGN